MEDREKSIGKKKVLVVAGLFLIVALSGLSSAVFWACYDQGQVVNFCHPAVPDRTCSSSFGCLFCAGSQGVDENGDFCIHQGNFNVCNTIPQECNALGGGSGGSGSGGGDGGDGGGVILDVTPPVVTFNNPEDGGVYDSRRVLLDFVVDERADVYYTILNSNRPREIRICNNCMSSSRARSFSDGVNELLFRAVDVVGNEDTFLMSITVDSRDPRIRSENPRRGYASGEFVIEFDESNPTLLELNYGNDVLGHNTAEVDLANCVSGRRGTTCTTNVDLSAYDGQSISYSHSLTDIAGTTVTSRRPIILDVDTTFPIINSIDYVVNRNRAELVIDITEMNFDQITAINNNDRRPRERRICSRLRPEITAVGDGVCKSNVRLNPGLNQLDIQVFDEAGNAVGQSLTIFV